MEREREMDIEMDMEMREKDSRVLELSRPLIREGKGLNLM